MSLDRPTPNPHPMFSTEWFAFKEEHDNYVPYHVGTTPSGHQCSVMPRVRVVRPGVYRCGACGKEFPTATAELEAKAAEASA